VKVSIRYAFLSEPTQTTSNISQALSWLGKNYFLPTLTKNAPRAPDSTPPLEPLLKQYKTLMKSILRDRSIQGSMEGDLDMALRSFDAWIGQAATAAWSLWDSDAAERGKWALEKLSLALTQSGGLVPVAKKYVSFNELSHLHLLSPLEKTTGYIRRAKCQYLESLIELYTKILSRVRPHSRRDNCIGDCDSG
jgi:hypothetical protein